MFKKTWLRRLLTIGVVAIFVLMLRQVNFLEIYWSMKKLTPEILILLLCLQVFTQLLQNYQWWSLSKALGLEAGFWPMLVINAKGVVMEAVTPGAKLGGEVTRALLFKESFGHTTSEATSLVGLQKVISLSALMALGLLALLALPHELPGLDQGVAKALIGLVLLGGILFFALLFFASSQLERWAGRRKYRGGKWQRGFMAWVEEFSLALTGLKGKRGVLVVQLFLSVLIWGLFPFKLILLVGAFGVKVSPVGLFAATMMAYLAAMIPLLPGGVGSFEITMGSMLVFLGLSKGDSASTAVIFRFVTFWFVVVLSFMISLLGNVMRRASVEKNII